MDVSRTAQELLRAHYLSLVEAAHPHIQFALQAEREASLDVLHGLFEGNIWSGCNQRVKMVRHNYECVQKKSPLAAIVEDSLLKQCCVGSDLKQPTALRGYSSDEVRASFLWSEPHMRSILQRPAAKAGLFPRISAIRLRRREQGFLTSEGAVGSIVGESRGFRIRQHRREQGFLTSEGAGFSKVGGSRGFQPPERKQNNAAFRPGSSHHSVAQSGYVGGSRGIPHSVTSEGTGFSNVGGSRGFQPPGRKQNNAAFRPGPSHSSPQMAVVHRKFSGSSIASQPPLQNCSFSERAR